MIELALPSGSLETALAAFRAGGDAVYFGMKEFSARKGATNFSEEDLSIIKRYARDNGKKIYVTVNTLVEDSELEKATRLLSLLDFYQPDGIIIQDLGLVEIIRTHFPSLHLHGSTQLAVHTVEGVKELQDLGFERVVLSRELSLAEMEHIRKACPDVELKAFVHGALCFGFSGLCMASRNLCERSANRGECAQVCRTWFTEERSGENGYFFSLEDLCAGESILRLNEIGIDSAKIEGRMKGSEYVAELARYYRSILDGKDYHEAEDRIKTTFSRKSGQGYFNYRADRESLLSGYPSHLGLPVGRVIQQNRNSIVIKCSRPILEHDGLQYIKTDSRGLPTAVKLQAKNLKKEGDRIIISHREDDDIRGLEVYKISSATQHEKKVSTNLPPYHQPVDVTLIIGPDSLTATASGKEASVKLEVNEASKPQNTEALAEEAFRQSGTSHFTLGKIAIENHSGLSAPFIPSSYLKTLRKELYAELDESYPPATPKLEETPNLRKAVTLPDRSLLEGDLPWSLEPKEIEGKLYITLPPVTFNEEKLFGEVESLMESHPALLIGLNNIGQLRLAKRHPEHSYIADIYLYQSNRMANRLLLEELGDSFVGGYLWIERHEKSEEWALEPTALSYLAPSFISRACFRHDAMGLPCKGCAKKEDFTIQQNNYIYTVKVRDCLTVVSPPQMKKGR